MTQTPELDRLRAGHLKFLDHIFQGRTPGAIFCAKILSVLHIYDDLIDGDKPTTKDEIHTAFWLATVDIPNDQFFSANRAILSSILANSILNWRVANSIEANWQGQGQALQDDKNLERQLGVAWILRGAYLDLISMSLAIEKGQEYAVNAGQLLRDWAHSETFPLYLSNLAKEKSHV